MAEPLPLANDGLPLRFAFLVELIDILDRSPMGDVPQLAFPEEAIQHSAAGQQTLSVSSLLCLVETMWRSRIFSIVSFVG